MRAIVLLASVVLCTSCGDLVSESNQVAVALPAQEDLVRLIRGVDDAAARVAPALADAGARAQVTKALDKLVATLNATDGPGADRALTQARAALVTYRLSQGQQPEDGPELSSIEITLDRVDGQLRRLCAQTTGASRVAARVVASQTQGCPK